MAAPRLHDRVKELVATEGPGSYTVGSTPATGYRSVPVAFANGETGLFVVEDGVGGYEEFVGTYTAPGTLARTSIIRSSNSNLAVNWAAGSKTLSCVLVADRCDLVRMKHNLTAGAAPTANDDANDGYHVGSLWVYGTTVYVCTTETAATAVWTSLGGTTMLQALNGTTPVISTGGVVALGDGSSATNNGALAIGDTAAASGADAVAVGTTTTASGASATAVGDSSTASGASATAIGALVSATGDLSLAIGSGAAATADRAVAVGGGNAQAIGSATIGGGTTLLDGRAYTAAGARMGAAVGGFGTYIEHPFEVGTGAGDESDHYVHRSDLVLWRLTTDATPTYAQFLNDVATYGEYDIGEGYAVGFEAQIVARSSADAKFWKITGLVYRNTAGNITIVGTPTVTMVAETAGATTWVADFDVDTGTQSLRFEHTGQAATTISWTTVVRATKVENYL